MPRALSLLPLALVLAGCGQQADTSGDLPAGPQREVAQAVERLEELGTEGDARTICDELLAGEFKQQLRSRSVDCVRVLDDALDDVDDHGLEVRSVRVTGTMAVAQVATTDAGVERVRPLTLVREGDRWKLARLG